MFFDDILFDHFNETLSHDNVMYSRAILSFSFIRKLYNTTDFRTFDGIL